jgi:hypothetical protein
MVNTVVTRSIDLLRGHWQALAGVALIVGSLNALVGLVTGLLLDQLLTDVQEGQTISLGTSLTASAASILVLAIGLVLSAVLVLMVADLDSGTTPQPGVLVSRVLARFLPLLGLMILSSLLVTFGLVLFIIPGIWIAVSLVPFVVVFFLEDRGPIATIRRSFELVRGSWWEVFVLVLMIAALNFAIGLVGLAPGAIGFLLAVIANAVTSTVQATVTYFIYAELRRKSDLADAF